MKIAINTCFGGFSLSAEAILELVKINSKLINKLKLSDWNGDDFEPFKDGFRKHKLYELIEKDGIVYSFDKKHRNHPDLIKVIEMLKEKANADFSKIEIIEIPDDVNWEIDEYDGVESVHETHRSWS